MELTELRIGNYVDYKGNYSNYGGFTEITPHLFQYLLDVWDEFELLQPINITEEILKRSGFKLKENQDELLDTFMWISDDEITTVEFSDKHGQLYWHDDYTSIYHKEIRYIHQFQNLYNSINSDELKIQLF